MSGKYGDFYKRILDLSPFKLYDMTTPDHETMPLIRVQDEFNGQCVWSCDLSPHEVRQIHDALGAWLDKHKERTA